MEESKSIMEEEEEEDQEQEGQALDGPAGNWRRSSLQLLTVRDWVMDPVERRWIRQEEALSSAGRISETGPRRSRRGK
jgi:hypothetical protein